MQQRPRWIREPFSAISHLLGAGLSIAGLVFLIILSQGKPWQIVSCAIYGASLIILYLASGVYHTLPLRPEYVKRLQKLDHIGIYVLIAGTYVPICLVTLRGGWGWSLFGVEYGLALAGILITLLWRNAPDWVRVVLYILMGWLASIALLPLIHALPAAGVAWLVGGGVVYTIGAVVYAMNKPNLWPGHFSAHDLWHIFVMGGSACHFILILRYVVPA